MPLVHAYSFACRELHPLIMSLSVVLPCYNEEENIENTTRDLLWWFDASQTDGEIIIVNDGSKDASAEIVQKLQTQDERVRPVFHEVNKGYGAAICSGCDVATKDVIGFMDSDGQFHAEDFAKLLPHIHEYDLVTGIRTKRADPLPRKLNAALYGTLTRLALGIKVQDLNCGMKIFKASAWTKLRPVYGMGALFNAEVFLAAKEEGIAFYQTPVGHYPRTAGNPTGAKISVILRMFKELFMLKKHRKRIKAEENMVHA